MATQARLKSTDTLAEINAQIERLDNPVHRHMLEVMRDHFWAEVVWDVPAIIATLTTSEPILYRFQGGAFLGIDGDRLESREAVQELYDNSRDAGVVIGPMENLTYTFGANGVAQECIQHGVFPGGALLGLAEVDADKWYHIGFYTAVYNPFDKENRYMTGEIMYAANKPLTLEEVDPATASEITGL